MFITYIAIIVIKISSVTIHVEITHRKLDDLQNVWSTQPVYMAFIYFMKCTVMYVQGAVHAIRSKFCSALVCLIFPRWFVLCSRPYAHNLSLYSRCGKTSYRQISRNLETVRLGVTMIVSLRNLTGASAAVLPGGGGGTAKVQSDWKCLNSNLAVSRLRKIMR